MIEVHDAPDKALSDGDQALLPDEFKSVVEKAARLNGLYKDMYASQSI